MVHIQDPASSVANQSIGSEDADDMMAVSQETMADMLQTMSSEGGGENMNDVNNQHSQPASPASSQLGFADRIMQQFQAAWEGIISAK